MLKKMVIVVAILALMGIGFATYLWYKPAPKAENQDAVKITAIKVFSDYNKNVKQADSLYLGKWLEVSGVVQQVDTNQDGQRILILEAGDLMQAVMCVMRDKSDFGSKGESVVVRGKCTGLVNDVVVNDCIVIGK